MVERPWLNSYTHAEPWETRFDPVPVHQLFLDTSENIPERHFLDFLGAKRTYVSVRRDVDAFAAALQALGVGKGTKVGLFLPNCPHYVVAYYSILRTGATVVNFSPLYSVDELRHQVEDSETDIMVCLDVASLFATIDEVLHSSRLKCLIVGSLASALPPGKALLYRMLKRRERAHVPSGDCYIRMEEMIDARGMPAPVEIDPLTDIALLQYTGGTTGVPKGAMLTHANVSINARQVASVVRRDPGTQDRMLGALPFFHVFANTVILNSTAYRGGEIVMLPKFELKQALATIQRCKVTMVPGVPTMYTAMLEYPDIGKYDLTSIEICISGGAPLPLEVKRRFEAKTGAIISEGYGLTECSGVAATNPFHGEIRSGSIGLPMPGTDIVIVDKDDPSRLLPLGEAGEITLGGPQVMRGYWKRPDADAQIFVDGRLRTGDVGYIDPDGYTFIIDRLKDMIMVGGFKVFPRQLEEVLYSHPAVAEAAVIGVPDPYLGERPKAFVVLAEEVAERPTADTLLEWLAPKVGKHERPKSIVIRASLPKTLIGKISKKELVAEEKEAAAAPSQA